MLIQKKFFLVAGFAILERQLADFFSKEPDSKDFRLCGLHTVSVAVTQLCYCSVKAAIDNMQMTCCNKILFMGTEI